jgi:AAA15 family ATPase/GTPase
MITELDIHNFRGFWKLRLDGLRRVNLLLGGNDTGKTSVLEAMVLLLGDSQAIQNLATTFRNNQSAGHSRHTRDDYENFWLWLFRNRDITNDIAISGKTAKGQSIAVRSKAPTQQRVSARGTSPEDRVIEREIAAAKETILTFQHGNLGFSHGTSPAGLKVSRLSIHPTHPVQDAEKYNLIALHPDGERKVEEVMRVIEPRLRRLRYAKLPGTSGPLVFADIGLPRALPSTQMGQAFNRILHIYAEILSKEANVLLIDEIENGIFTETMPMIWKGILAICEAEGVQIFATSHSRECVMAALRAAEERGKDELMVYRLQRVREEVEAVRLEKRHLELAAEMGLEVRS